MLELKSIAKTYGTGPNATHAVGDVSFSIDEGEFVCVVGPSGCGKTTLISVIAGLLDPTAGEVEVLGASLTRQFEFVQTQWVNDGRYIAAPAEKDPLVGGSGGVHGSSSRRAPAAAAARRVAASRSASQRRPLDRRRRNASRRTGCAERRRAPTQRAARPAVA